MLHQSPFNGTSLTAIAIQTANVFSYSRLRLEFLLQLRPCNIQPGKDLPYQDLKFRSIRADQVQDFIALIFIRHV